MGIHEIVDAHFEELVKDVGLNGVFESFNHVFDTVFGSWNGN